MWWDLYCSTIQNKMRINEEGALPEVNFSVRSSWFWQARSRCLSFHFSRDRVFFFHCFNLILQEGNAHQHLNGLMSHFRNFLSESHLWFMIHLHIFSERTNLCLFVFMKDNFILNIDLKILIANSVHFLPFLLSVKTRTAN